MPDLVLHPQTKAQLTALAAQPTHAVLLSGPPGMGKATLAGWLGEAVLELKNGQLDSYPYSVRLQPEGNKAIPIDAVRQLEHFMSLKIPGDRNISRLALIIDAHLLTGEAQNALLKTLEEPPVGTMLILTSSHDQALLPTIRSRVQTIAVKRPAISALQTQLEQAGFSTAQVKSALAISGGLPGLAYALASGDEEHPLVQAAKTARELLQLTTFERLCLVDSLSKQRERAQDMLFILGQMAHAALAGKTTSVQRWQNVLKAAYSAQEQLLGSAQPKLVLTNLMLNL